MGTNYYYIEDSPCECCKREYEPIHIGKNSFGWVFTLHIIPVLNINNLEDWFMKLNNPNSIIEDEYGERISLDKFKIIVNKAKDNPDLLHNECYKQTDICDYMFGEFS